MTTSSGTYVISGFGDCGDLPTWLEMIARDVDYANAEYASRTGRGPLEYQFLDSTWRQVKDAIHKT